MTEILASHHQAYLRARPQLHDDLPHPDETWRLADREFGQPLLRNLHDKRIVEKVERKAGYSPGEKTRSFYWVWRTTRTAWMYIQSCHEYAQCPNGTSATGISNLRDEPGYTCDVDDCDCRMTRAEAEAILD